MPKPKLVAHRGYAEKYPENTMAAFEAAVSAGARYIELDVQLTSDHVPIIMHDDDLLRTTGVSVSVLRTPWASIAQLCAGERERFGDRYKDEPIPRLSDLVKFLQRHRQVTAYVEIKTESIFHFGQHVVVQTCLDVLRPVLSQCVLISYDLSSLIEGRNLGFPKIGWILTHYNQEEQKHADVYKPDYIISNYKKVKMPLWSGPWDWFFYEIVEPNLALEWFAKGVKYIETMQIAEMLADPRLNDSSA